MSHTFKVGQNLLATVKEYKYKDKLVKVLELKMSNESEPRPYYMVSGDGIFGTMSLWEHELKETI